MPHIESRAISDVGLVRDRNEDSFCVRDADGFWAVADGMGGHVGGEWAATRLTDHLAAVPLTQDFEAACAAVEVAVKSANDEIRAEGLRRGGTMGTTFAGLLLRDGCCTLFWAGDSRAYRLRDGRLELLTRDHSRVQELVDGGLLAPEDAPGHPLGHVLTRAVGIDPEVQVERKKSEARPGDIHLLCSDGVHSCLDESEIARRLALGAPGRVVEALLDAAVAAGAPDNVTAIALRLGSS